MLLLRSIQKRIRSTLRGTKAIDTTRSTIPMLQLPLALRHFFLRLTNAVSTWSAGLPFSLFGSTRPLPLLASLLVLLLAAWPAICERRWDTNQQQEHELLKLTGLQVPCYTAVRLGPLKLRSEDTGRISSVAQGGKRWTLIIYISIYSCAFFLLSSLVSTKL